MARDIVVRVTCDLCQAGDAEQMSLLVGNRTLEIDVCATHLAEYEKAIAPYVAMARPVESRPASAPQRRSSQSRAEAAKIREWARREGLELSHRGRIPLAVLDAYTRSG